ncbi:hypothetical protein HOLleu_35107 [Holothuria leucospilota]|uniref:Uncharacterized protein n=1 Tax=Holothuria leucospilota TaxID=206669 RepID=A0A9Q0YPA3_HOLLE|nr:hypothetical protein HOLleu_35107 [Holothuria leucospilota]
MSDTEPVDSDVEVEDLTSKFSKILERAMRKISQDLKDLDDEVRGVIDNHTKQIKDLQTKNKRLAERVSTLEEKIQDLHREKESHADQINKQERFSRRNNLRIVGFKTEAEENPIEIAKEVFTKAGVENCRIERAHRDGRVVEGRNRHILVKVSFYMDKVTLLRNSRSHLSQEGYYLTDDLTLIDLKEKRKYSREVAELYRSGTKLRFFGGRWRSSDAGDFNFVFNLELDKKGGNSNTNFKARAECLALMTSHHLLDIWRERNPCLKYFTWSSNITPGIHCRLDFFLVAKHLCHAISNVSFSPGIQSDHSFVQLTISHQSFRRGPGLWKLNNSLLNDPDFIVLITDLIENELSHTNAVFFDPCIRWDFIKFKIRQACIKFSKQKARERTRKEETILNRIASLEQSLFVCETAETRAQLREAQSELLLYYNYKLQGTIIRSRAR